MDFFEVLMTAGSVAVVLWVFIGTVAVVAIIEYFFLILRVTDLSAEYILEDMFGDKGRGEIVLILTLTALMGGVGAFKATIEEMARFERCTAGHMAE